MRGLLMKYVPNILTVIRLLLVPLFAIVYFSGASRGHLIALIIFLVASFTDFLDGYLARKYQSISKIGTVLDPLADKLMLLTALGSLAIDYAIPFVIFYLFLAKEIFMILAGAILWYRKERMVIASSLPGKAATALSMLMVILLIIYPHNSILVGGLIVAFALKLIALLTYVKVYKAKA